MTDLRRRDFFTRGLPGRLVALLGGGMAAAPVATAAAAARPGDDVSVKDLRRMSRAEVREALRRIRTQRRAH